MRIILEIFEEDPRKIFRCMREAEEGVRRAIQDDGEGAVSGRGWRVEVSHEDKRDYLIYSNEGDTFPPYISLKSMSANPQILGIAPGEDPDNALDHFLFSERGGRSLVQGFKNVIVRRIGGKAHYRKLE